MRSSPAHHEAFVAVLDHGSISAAARALGLPRPTLSRHLGRLEADLGVALLHRTTRKVTATAAGQRLYERVAPLLASWAEAELDLAAEAGTASGEVRVSVMPELAAGFAPVVSALRESHPQVRLEVVSRVTLPDLRSEGFDAAVWPGDPQEATLRVRTLAVGHVGVVASPAYLREHGTPTRPEHLAHHRLLCGHNAHGRPRSRWPCFDGSPVRVAPAFVSNDATLLLAAALAGEGLCLLSDRTAAPALEAGRLVRVLEREVGRQATVRLVHAAPRPMPRRLRVVLDAIAAHFVVPAS